MNTTFGRVSATGTLMGALLPGLLSYSLGNKSYEIALVSASGAILTGTFFGTAPNTLKKAAVVGASIIAAATPVVMSGACLTYFCQKSLDIPSTPFTSSVAFFGTLTLTVAAMARVGTMVAYYLNTTKEFQS